MRVRWICGAALFSLAIGIARPAFGQGGEVSDEVKRAVERAVGASVTSAVAESLSRSIVSEGLTLMPTTTVFGGPFYNRTNGDFSSASFKSDTYGGVAGVLFKVNDFLLLHGAVAGSGTHVKTEGTGFSSSTDAKFIDFVTGGDAVFLNTEPVKGWFTLEGGVSYFDTDISDHIWTWRVKPSATLSFRAGPILFEPTVGFTFSRPFEGVRDPDTTLTVEPGFALKYRGEKFRPQLNFTYQRVLLPGDSKDDGVISVGPEILYAVTPSILLGVSYSYSTPLNKDIDVRSHTAAFEFRWIF